MAKYTKHNSNYVRVGKHQTLKDGSTIFERDWVTLGGRWNFGRGKIPYYTNGNFIFTTSPTPNYQKKHKNGNLVGEWTYNDVKDATSVVNQINPDEKTEDIRSFVCYGSCLELVRSTIENIIKTFPGSITLTNEQLEVPTDNGFKPLNEKEKEYIINNPFGIDLLSTEINLDEYENEMRYIGISYEKYEINGVKIWDYVVEKLDVDINCPKNDQYYIKKAPIVTITITDENENNYELNGYKYGNDVLFCYKGDALEIKPNDEYIENYFSNLKGLEKCLLNRKSKPLYTNRFVTPLEYNLGYVYYKRTYTWPSNGYCIDVTSSSYVDFINKISSMAQLFDELCTDNIWRKMTHEAIKNYDWTYTRQFEEGEERDNIDGGERMHKVLNIIGRMFDDNKRYIDMIKQNNKVTYNGDRNIPNALISDKLELNGFEVYSTIPNFEPDDDEDSNDQNSDRKQANISETKITDDFITNINKRNDTEVKWFDTWNNNTYTAADADVDFMRRMLLSSKHILATKGTINSIEMIMAMFGYGENDFSISEEYRTVKPKEYDSSYDDSDNTDNSSFGDKIVDLNLKKNIDLNYEDDTSGIPVSSFVKTEYNNGKITNTTYVIPFYNQNKIYDGDITFQSNGGWLKDGEEGDYTETLSYLHVVPTVGSLFDINPNSIADGDIYYVVSVSDYIDYSESTDKVLYSNFFVVDNVYLTNNLQGWRSIDLEDESDDIAQKAIYLNSIIPDNIGNNPHVGYGRYDMGEEFFNYMKQPFKYAIDRDTFDSMDKEQAIGIEFEIEKQPRVSKDEKIINFLKTDESHNLVEDETKKYYLNSKVIYFTNNMDDNEYFKVYFRNVILKYVMQVIPSTAIIVLENF